MKRTARYYKTGSTVKGKSNPAKAKKARAKKDAKSKEVNKRPEQKAKRAELGRIRTKAKSNGKKIKGKDYDHATKRFVKSSTNRGRKEKSRLKGSKRKKK